MQLDLRLYTLTEVNDFSSGSQARMGCRNDTQYTYFCEGYGSFQLLAWSFMVHNSTPHQSDSEYEEIMHYFVKDTWNNTNDTASLREIIQTDHYRVMTVLIQDKNDKQSCQNPKLASTLTVQIFSDIKFSVKCTIDGNNNSINKTVYHPGLAIGKFVCTDTYNFFLACMQMSP